MQKEEQNGGTQCLTSDAPYKLPPGCRGDSSAASLLAAEVMLSDAPTLVQTGDEADAQGAAYAPGKGAAKRKSPSRYGNRGGALCTVVESGVSLARARCLKLSEAR